MDRFHRLHVFLEDLLFNPTSDPEVLSTLQLKLERARPYFLELLDLAPKNTKERQKLEKGTFTYVVDGTDYPIGQALSKEVQFLSDTLSASEDLCASYVSYGINARPRYGAGRAENGLIILLNERQEMLRCLQAIWRGALSADERLRATGVQRMLELETLEITRPDSGQTGASISTSTASSNPSPWLKKVIKTVESSKEAADQLRSSLLQPISGSLALTKAGTLASFGDDITSMRAQRYEEERILLCQLLFLIGAGSQLRQEELRSLMRILKGTSSGDSACVYLLVTTMIAIDSSDMSGSEAQQQMCDDTPFMTQMTEVLNEKWEIPELKSALQLQWATFLNFASHKNAMMESNTNETVDQLTWQAIEGGALAFLGRQVLAYKWSPELDEIWSNISGQTPSVGGDTVEEWFQSYITDQVEILVLDLICDRMSILRKLRNKEEDVVATFHRGGGHRVTRGTLDERPREVRRHIESFFCLVATLYFGNPDGGLKFWEDPVDTVAPMSLRLLGFLRWGSESRPPAMARAYYDMVASLATGTKSATYAFEFLSGAPTGDGRPGSASQTVSWSALFGALEFYHTHLTDRPIEAGANAEGVIGEMPPDEVPLLKSFVRLLRQVVSYSDVARATLYDNQRHRPIATLFALLGRPIPIELKASLIEAIAAFSRPGGSFGVDVARRTWVALEQSQILPTLAHSEGRDPRGGAGTGVGRSNAILRGPVPLSIEGGILTELEEVEAPNKVYPESTAFVQLLVTLIHTPSSIQALRQGGGLDAHTIPDNLGAPHRSPGIDPYIRFAVDDVLLKSGSREYIDPRERWKVTLSCLTFVEKCLASYNFGPFLAWSALGDQNGQSSPSSPLNQLVVHPGFDVLIRILSGSELLETILTILTAGYDAIVKDLAGTPLFAQCMLRCLRIIRKTLDLQAPFLEVVLPSLGESTIQIPHEKLGRLKNLVPIDQSLLYHSEVVVQIALLVGCEGEDEISLLAVQIIGRIADSPFFDVIQAFPDQRGGKLNRLVGLLEASPETIRILEGFVARLEENVPESDLEMGEYEGSDGSAAGSNGQGIRSAILDLFLKHTLADMSGLNIAHLLLGFDVHARLSEMEVDDPDLPDTRRTCLHVVLEHLAQIVTDGKDTQLTLLSRHPTFAAKLYRLVHQLCLSPITAAPVSRYLRNRENFFLKQVSVLPFGIPSTSSGALGDVQYGDGRSVVTSSAAVCAILAAEAWLMESIALELNVVANDKDIRRLVDLTNLLFKHAGVQEADDESIDKEPSGTGQGLPRMLEMFHDLDFAWHDSIQVANQHLNLLGELRFESCLKPDSSGCEIYDFEALFSLLAATRRELQHRGVLSTQTQQEDLKREILVVVETLVVENHRREIHHVRLHALRAWRNVLDIALAKSFHLLPTDERHALLLDFMASILPPLIAQETALAISELLSGAAVLLMTELRNESFFTVASGCDETSQSVSTSRLHSILRLVLHAILQPGNSAVVRGNLYAFLLNYIQYCSKVAGSSPSLTRSIGDETVSLVDEDMSSLDGISITSVTRRTTRGNSLESVNFAIFQSAIDRIVPVLCRDASFGEEVWRTMAFTALDALLALAEEGKSSGKVLSILSKQGYLQGFLASLVDAEASLQEALKPLPESLNALYVYEAQMSFLIRVASSRDGAEKLLSAGALSKLAECNYLGSRPNAYEPSLDLDGFLPAAKERHHQLLFSALQFIVGTLVSFGYETPVASQQAMAFVFAQRETLLVAIGDCKIHQSIASLKETHLIVTLLSIVLPSVSDGDLATLSSFGGLHSAILSLSAKVCGSQEWVRAVIPSNDTEYEEDQNLVAGLRGSASQFSEKVERLAESLQAALFTYQTVATRKRPGSSAFRPVLQPDLKHSPNLASGPTLRTAAAYLKDAVKTLAGRLQDVDSLSQMIDNFGNISSDEIIEALSLAEDNSQNDSDKRNLLLHELRILNIKFAQAVAHSLHLVELALLLYWRHVAFFLDPERVNRNALSGRPDVGLGLAESLRSRSTNSVATFDLPALKKAIEEDFSPIASELEGLVLTHHTAGPNFRSAEAYSTTIIRKIHDLLRVTVE